MCEMLQKAINAFCNNKRIIKRQKNVNNYPYKHAHLYKNTAVVNHIVPKPSVYFCWEFWSFKRASQTRSFLPCWCINLLQKHLNALDKIRNTKESVTLYAPTNGV